MKEKEFLARFAPKFRGRKAGRSLHALLVETPAEEDTGAALHWLEKVGEWVLDGPVPHSVDGSVAGESPATSRLRMLLLALREVRPWRAATAKACAQLTDATNGVRLLCRTGLPAEQSRLLAVSLVGMAQVSARFWVSEASGITQEQAVELVTGLAWRGIRGYPKTEEH